MRVKQITIINKLGLHARAAAKFVNVASTFRSQIYLHGDKRGVNGKSIMGVMTLGAAKGTMLTLSVEGDDENEALMALENLILARFDEKE